MNDNIFAEIEVMEARNASFEEYFHKILEITNRPQNKTEEALLVYKIISTIKKLGYQKGKNDMIINTMSFLNDKLSK